MKDELLHGKTKGGNLRVKTKEFVAAVAFDNDVLYHPKGVTGFDINFQKGCWLTMNDGTEISMSDNLHELVQKQKELVLKLLTELKQLKKEKLNQDKEKNSEY